jgi:predicted Zn-dependent protease
MLKQFTRPLLAILVLTISVSITRAADPPASDVEMVNNVSRLLLAVTDPPEGMKWPPKFRVVDSPEINAFATAILEVEGERPVLQPLVVVFTGLMKKVIVIKDDPDPAGAPDRLAYVLGHELSHLLLKHILITPEKKKQTDFVRLVFSREQEIAADLKGAELLMKAGFSHSRGMHAVRRMNKAGLGYSSFEGLQASHPSWDDRIALLDKKQGELWKSMSAFNNGNYFLMAEQYPAAEVCFRRVTEEFPKCHEAWANLGYALLMQYCDGLDADDMRQLKLGQMMIGGFYRRPKSLESQVRGMDEKVWKQAVAALEKSEQLVPGQVIVQANLGVAYLVHPSGKPKPAQARKYFEAAASGATRGDAVDPWMKAAIFLNAGVADLAAGQVDDSDKKFTRSSEVGTKYFGGVVKVGMVPGLANALSYNRAMVLADSKDEKKRKQAVDSYERYLKAANPGSAWWPIAYDRYAALCKDVGKKPIDKDLLIELAPTTLRLVTSVKLDTDATLVLGQPISDAAGKLGVKIPAVSRTKITRVRFPKYGVDVLATDTILAICLAGPNAPVVPLKAKGGGAASPVRLGMTEAELERLLEDEDFDSRRLDDPNVSYRFYPGLGLGVRIKDKKVAEVVIAQIPRERKLPE